MDKQLGKQTPQHTLKAIVSFVKTEQRTISGITRFINLTAAQAKIPLRVTSHEVTIALGKIKFARM